MWSENALHTCALLNRKTKKNPKNENKYNFFGRENGSWVNLDLNFAWFNYWVNQNMLIFFPLYVYTNNELLYEITFWLLSWPSLINRKGLEFGLKQSESKPERIVCNKTGPDQNETDKSGLMS